MASSGPERGWWFHQWHSKRNPITVYYDDVLVAEYEGRFKLLRAWLRTLRPAPEEIDRNG